VKRTVRRVRELHVNAKAVEHLMLEVALVRRRVLGGRRGKGFFERVRCA
jgi:hypothetical protein